MMQLLWAVLTNPAFFVFLFVASSWFLMWALGRPMIAWFKALRGMKWSPREDTPDSHLQKAGTPSMGGLGIVGAALAGFLSTLAFMLIASRFLDPYPSSASGELIPFLFFPPVVLLHALLGFADDWSKARGKGGLLARQKLAGQVVLAVAFLVAFVYYGRGSISEGWSWPMAIGVSLLVIIATSNAVNLTDGIDGLAAGLSVQCAVAFAAFIFFNEHNSDMRDFGASAILFWLSLGGACLGFLVYNKYPAKIFMGDTGSLALGAALGAGAVVIHAVFLLPFIGFIFFVEMFSVIAQVVYFKYTRKKYGEGRRIFRRAPLHHHFELGGWSERRVVWTFWGINALTSIVGLLLWWAELLPRFP